MTNKQKLILAFLLVMALVPMFTGGKKHASKTAPSAVTSATSNLISEADKALLELAALDKAHAMEQPSVDNLLQGSQMAEMPAEAPGEVPEQVSEVAPATTTTLPEEPVIPEPPPVQAKLEEEVKTPAPKIKKGPSAEEIEKTNWEIAALRNQLRDVQNDFKKRETDLVQQLGVEQEENVKLSHKLQELERKTAEAQKGEKRQKDLQDQVKQLEDRLDAQAKLSNSRKSEKADLEQQIKDGRKIQATLEKQLAEAVKEQEARASENEKLRAAVGDFEQRIKILEEQRLADSEEKDKVLMKRIASIQKDLASAMTAAEDGRKKSRSFSAELEQVKTQLEQSQKQLLEKQKEADDLAVKLGAALRLNEETKGLQQELLQAQNELLLAKEQVNTLRTTSRSATSYQQPSYPERTYPSMQGSVPAPDRAPVARQVNPNDYVTVEVTAPKVVLRAGPGEDHSPIMEVNRGSTLMVETREGNWYRVITPKGGRAYLRVDLAVEAGTGAPARVIPAPAPRAAAVPTRVMVTPAARVEKAAPPSSDPLIDILGNTPAPPPEPAAPLAAPTPNEDEERSAFEALKNLKQRGDK